MPFIPRSPNKIGFSCRLSHFYKPAAYMRISRINKLLPIVQFPIGELQTQINEAENWILSNGTSKDLDDCLKLLYNRYPS